MKNLCVIVLTVFFASSVFAQLPQKMSYQAVIRNSGNQLVTNHAVGMRISILQSSATGTSVYTETHTPTTNANGLISIEIGGGTNVTGIFADIDWSAGTYFIKSETDPAGGTSYNIIGTSQLLSVPYALYAKTSESVTGTITETDPVYSVSQAVNITSSDIVNLGNLRGVNTGDQDLSGLATTTALNLKVDKVTGKGLSTNDYTNAEATKVSNLSGVNTGDQDLSTLATTSAVTIALATKVDKVAGKDLVPNGTVAGQMQYWNGTAWVTISSGSAGQILTVINGVPSWSYNVSSIPQVTNSTTGKIWMDRNLGASQIATSRTDAASYGDLYQWGRGADGHQLRTSATTTILSSTDSPGNANYILTPNLPCNWRSPENTNLWQGVNGVNNPCPSGFRIPTDVELDAERASWSVQNAVGAFGSPLKFPLAGYRYIDGSPTVVGTVGFYWSSTIAGANSRSLTFHNGTVFFASDYRAYGYSVRCIKD